jgi:hypothetical protein
LFGVSLVVLGLVYLVVLHRSISDNGFSGAAEGLRDFTDTLFVTIRDVMDVERCPLHESQMLHQGFAEPVEMPARTRHIYRRPEIAYCGFYLSNIPGLEELPYPGIFYPDTLLDSSSAPPVLENVCDECRSAAFIYLEPHHGFYLGTDATWKLPRYSLIPPPTPSSPNSPKSIAALW